MNYFLCMYVIETTDKKIRRTIIRILVKKKTIRKIPLCQIDPVYHVGHTLVAK